MENASSKDLITEDQVKKVLLADKGEQAQLTFWEIVDFTKPGDNYSRFVTSILVKYSLSNQESQVSYVVKVNPCSVFDERKSHQKRASRKEAMFFLDLIPALNSALEATGKEQLHFPKCFHGNLEAGKEQVYFEDLRAKGFRMFDRKKGLDVDHTTLVLRELARFHAAWYLLKAKRPTENPEEKYDFLLKDHMEESKEKAKSPLVSVIEGNFTFTINVLKKVGGNVRVMNWIESLKPQIEHIVTKELHSEKFGSICHGDCWNNNILFRYDDDGKAVEAMLLDLEICRQASVALDLNYLFYTSLTGDVRRAHLGQFLHVYYSAYSDVIQAGDLSMPFNEEELLKEFREKYLVGATFGMLVLPAIFAESVTLPDPSEFGGDHEKYANEFRSRLLASMDTNPLTEPRFLSMFDDFMEAGVIP